MDITPSTVFFAMVLGILAVLVITSIIAGNEQHKKTPRIVSGTPRKDKEVLKSDDDLAYEKSSAAIDTYFPPPLEVQPIHNGHVGQCPPFRPQKDALPFSNVPMWSY